MKISIITLFPKVFEPMLNSSIWHRAQKKGLVKYELIDLREFGEGRHQVVDGRPYGGGAGMILRADCLLAALRSIKKQSGSKVILTSASGKPFSQKKANSYSKLTHLILICGHYEGVDQRFIDRYVDEEVSIGDYVLTGGEIPTMAIIDAVVRLVPKVLEKKEAVEQESFSLTYDNKPLLEYPHYTRPSLFEEIGVPEVLVGGNHAQIDRWRNKMALKKTKQNRPELLKGV